MVIRPYRDSDAAALWAVLGPTIRAGETLAANREMTMAEGIPYWTANRSVFVAEDEGRIVGTSYVRPNYPGGGAHVANGGYVTLPDARGRGVARALCAHSLEIARARGFRAMQFNFVVSTNERAVRLWQSMGFAIVGTLPCAFAHPTKGDVDAYVMFQKL